MITVLLRRAAAVLATAALAAALLPPAAAKNPSAPAAPAPADHLAFGHGLLWKLAAAGVPPSYVFGTVHSGDPRVTRLPLQVNRAFEDSDEFMMEVVPDAALTEQMRHAMSYPRRDRGGLKKAIGEPLYDKVVAALAKYHIPEQMANRMKPWAVATTLSIPETAAGVPLDQQLYTAARRQNKSIFGIETAAEQIAVLNGMKPTDQIELLRGAVGTFNERFKIYEALIHDYLARDITAIFALDHKYSGGNHALARDVEQRLFLQRNKRMVRRILPHLRDGKVFVAVGAGHLAGDNGMLSLLQKQGYTVTRLY